MGEGTWISGAPVHATTSEQKDKGTGVWAVVLERAQKVLRTHTQLNKVLPLIPLVCPEGVQRVGGMEGMGNEVEQPFIWLEPR